MPKLKIPRRLRSLVSILLGALQIWDWIKWVCLGMLGIIEGWYLQHQYSDWPLTLILVFISCGIALFLVEKGKNFFGTEASRRIPAVNTAAVANPVVRLLVYRARASFKLHSPGANATFTFWIYNGSPEVSLTVKRIEGRIKWQGEKLSGNVQMVGHIPMIPPGTNGTVTFEQGIFSDREVQHLAKSIHADGGVIFSFDAVQLFISANSHEVTWPLPDVLRGTGGYDQIRWQD